jgi:hypothetical protein
VKKSEKEEESQEEEERKMPKWKKMLPSCVVLMDPEVLSKLILYSFEEFKHLQVSSAFQSRTPLGMEQFRKMLSLPFS